MIAWDNQRVDSSMNERMNEASPLSLLYLLIDESSYVLVAGVSDNGP